MKNLSEELINEIAQQFDCGFRCFFHRQTFEFIFVPDFLNNPYFDRELFHDELDNLDNNLGDFIEIDRPESCDSFEIMVKFAENIIDNDNLKFKLINALNRNKPFREFKFVIDNSGVYRQKWFDFKNSQLRLWVINKYNVITNNE